MPRSTAISILVRDFLERERVLLQATLLLAATMVATGKIVGFITLESAIDLFTQDHGLLLLLIIIYD